MPTPSLLIDLLSRTDGLAELEVEQLISWVRLVSFEGETVPAAMVRLGLMQPSALRTLDLIQRGFVFPSDAMCLLTANALSRIRSEVLSTPQSSILPNLGQSELLSHSPSAGFTAESTAPVPPNPALAVPTKSDSEGFAGPGVRETVRGQVRNFASPDHPGLTTKQTTHTAAAIAPSVGASLGKCLLTGILGKGGHGIVYSALHTTLNIPVAVKVLLNADGGPVDSMVRTQLRQEAQTLARLNHPNVIRVLDYDDGAVPYVVMEFVEGPSLADLITQTGAVRADRAMEMLYQTVQGLAAAWEFRIVHRDIKPGNILLNRGGTAKVADLGLAISTQQQYVDDPNAAGLPVGTCAYMAPEQARNAHAVDFRADIYALGATFYHAITGRMPFSAQTPFQLIVKHAMDPVVPPHTLGGNPVDRPVSDLIVRMMAKNPDDRFESYAKLLEAIEQIAEGTPIDTTDNRTPPALTQPPTVKGSGIIGRLFQFRRTQ